MPVFRNGCAGNNNHDDDVITRRIPGVGVCYLLVKNNGTRTQLFCECRSETRQHFPLARRVTGR